MLGVWNSELREAVAALFVDGLEHKSGARNPTRERGYLASRTSLTLRVAELSLLATAEVMIKAFVDHASSP